MKISIPTVYRLYAGILGVIGLLLLLKEQGRLAYGLAAFSLAAALCALAFSTLKKTGTQQRTLFWFALLHTALWLAILTGASWAWTPGIGDRAVSIIGTTGWLLFHAWLYATGVFPRTPFGPEGFASILNPPARAAEPLRSEYEQRIRQAAAQEERNRLARDLHDSIKQQIFAIQTAAATAQVRFDGNSTAAREALDQIRSSAREAMTEMEVMLDQLRAEPLERTGLVEALKKLCETTGFRTGAHVEFNLGEIPPLGTLSSASAEATLRVAQEALANVARHARAAHVWVSLNAKDGSLALVIKDDGTGFDPRQSSRGMGTTNMRTRAEELNGSFDLTSRPAEGTTVRFSVPYAPEAPRATPSQYRNRAISLGLMLAGVLFHEQAHHWSVAPAILFITGVSVFHFVKRSAGGVRSWSVTAA